MYLLMIVFILFNQLNLFTDCHDIFFCLGIVLMHPSMFCHRGNGGTYRGNRQFCSVLLSLMFKFHCWGHKFCYTGLTSEPHNKYQISCPQFSCTISKFSNSPGWRCFCCINDPLYPHHSLSEGKTEAQVQYWGPSPQKHRHHTTLLCNVYVGPYLFRTAVLPPPPPPGTNKTDLNIDIYLYA